MKSNEKFLYYTTESDLFAGINHQISNLICLLSEAKMTGRTAVVTPFFLAEHHNDGKALKVYFDKYLDLTELGKTVNFIRQDDFEQKYSTLPTEKITEKIPLMEAQEKDTSVLIRTFEGNLFRALRVRNAAIKKHYELLNTLLRPSAGILKIARQVLPTQDYYVVHVRRSDLLDSGWWKYPGVNLDKGTQPDAIHQRISQWIEAGSTLYIMTDEYEKGFFDSLKKYYQVLTFRDFEALIRLKKEDNFMLYEVEKRIAKQAKISVEMFNEYAESGKHKYSLFDYPRSGTKEWHYLLIGRLVRRYRRVKKLIGA